MLANSDSTETRINTSSCEDKNVLPLLLVKLRRRFGAFSKSRGRGKEWDGRLARLFGSKGDGRDARPTLFRGRTKVSFPADDS